MNDLPQNELFSAYLDGELTAAEQAEVERLLATSPAARQLLDELRTLSATLQALPQQKVGEDLSQRVLRVAERRMLTEGLDERENAPVPLERSVFRRFVNTRTLVWLGLTLAVALMITINDRRHRVPPAADAGKEVALAKREVEDRRRETSEPPSIHAPRSAATELAKEAKKADNLAEEKVVAAPTSSSPAGKPSVGARPFEFSTRKAADKDVAADGSALFAKPAVARSAPAESTTPAEAAAHSDNKIAASGPVPAKPDAVSERARTCASTGSSFGGGAGPPSATSRLPGLPQWAAGKRLRARRRPKPAKGCSWSSATSAPKLRGSRNFDKLLDANGIALQENSGQAARPSVAQSVANRVQQAVDLNAKQKPAANSPVRPAAAAGEVDFVYVEATPAQIDATLSGLWAQPDVFHSVSLNAEPDEAGPSAIVPEIVRQQLRANQVQGSSLAACAGLATPVKRQPLRKPRRPKPPRAWRSRLSVGCRQARAVRSEVQRPPSTR